MSSWKFPGGSPDPIICCLLWTYFTACQREQTKVKAQHTLVLEEKAVRYKLSRIFSTWPFLFLEVLGSAADDLENIF